MENFEQRMDRPKQGQIAEAQLQAMQEATEAAKRSAQWTMYAAIAAAVSTILSLLDHIIRR